MKESKRLSIDESLFLLINNLEKFDNNNNDGGVDLKEIAKIEEGKEISIESVMLLADYFKLKVHDIIESAKKFSNYQEMKKCPQVYGMEDHCDRVLDNVWTGKGIEKQIEEYKLNYNKQANIIYESKLKNKQSIETFDLALSFLNNKKFEEAKRLLNLNKKLIQNSK